MAVFRTATPVSQESAREGQRLTATVVVRKPSSGGSGGILTTPFDLIRLDSVPAGTNLEVRGLLTWTFHSRAGCYQGSGSRPMLLSSFNHNRNIWTAPVGEYGPTLFAYLVDQRGFVEDQDLFRYEWETMNSDNALNREAVDLRRYVDWILGRYLAAGYDKAKVTVIGHSAGGILVRYWLAADPDYPEKVNMAFTVGSPHRGVPMANWYGAWKDSPVAWQLSEFAMADFNARNGWPDAITMVTVSHTQDEWVPSEIGHFHVVEADTRNDLIEAERQIQADTYLPIFIANEVLLIGYDTPPAAYLYENVHNGMILFDWRAWFTFFEHVAVVDLPS